MNAPAIRKITADDGYLFRSPIYGHFVSMFKEMENMQREHKLCDVIVTVRGVQFKAHKLILASASKYFATLFEGEGGEVEVGIDDIPATAFRSLLGFLYTGEILITLSNLQDLLVACQKFALDKLEPAFAESMSTLLNPDTLVRIKAIASEHKCESLRRTCHMYEVQHFTDIAVHGCFLQLPLGELDELITDDELMVPCEEEVYAAVLRWIKHDLANRRPFLSQLMKHVRLPLLDQTCFRNSVAKEPLLRENFECTKLLLEATEYQSGVQCEPSPRTVPRKHYRHLETIQEMLAPLLNASPIQLQNRTFLIGRSKQDDQDEVISSIQRDSLEALRGKQWLLSAYAPFLGKASFPGFEDQSFEEIRYGFSQAQRGGYTEQFKLRFDRMYRDAESRMKLLQNISNDDAFFITLVYRD